MATLKDKKLEDLLGKCSAWLPKRLNKLGVHSTPPIDMTSAVCKRAMKDTPALLFTESYHFVRLQTEKMKQLKAELSSTKSQLIENQKWVINIQETIIREKNKVRGS